MRRDIQPRHISGLHNSPTTYHRVTTCGVGTAGRGQRRGNIGRNRAGRGMADRGWRWGGSGRGGAGRSGRDGEERKVGGGGEWGGKGERRCSDRDGAEQ